MIVSRSRKRVSPPATSSGLIRLWSSRAITPSTMSPPISADGPQIASADGEVEAAGEHRQAVEQPPGVLVEEVVAPGDRAAQRLLARRQVARAGGQQVELVLQPAEDRLGRQELDPRGGQLDGQRHAVEPGADGRHRGRVLVGDGEARPDRHRALDEQAHGGVLLDRGRVDDRATRRAGQPLEPLRWLGSGGAGRPGTGYSCSPETCRAARLVTTTLIAGAVRSRSATIGAGRDDLLEVVEHEQDASCRAASRRASSAIGRARRLRRRRRRRAILGATSIGSRIGSSGTKKTPSAKSSETRAASWSDSRVLPVPPGPGQRQQPGRAEQGRRPRPARRRDRRRSSAGSAGCSDGRRASAARGNSDGSPSTIDLDQVVRRQQVLEADAPRSRSVTPGGRCVDEQAARRVGHEDLAAMGDRRDPRRLVDVDADHAAAAAAPTARLRRCGGPSGPGRPRRRATPRLRARAGRRPRRRRAEVARPNDDEEGIALGALLDPAVRLPTPRAGARGGARGTRHSARCRARCSSCVEPSMSLNRKVTVPAGSAVGLGHPCAVVGVSGGRLRSARAAATASPRRIARATRRLLEQDGLEVPRREGEAGRRSDRPRPGRCAAGRRGPTARRRSRRARGSAIGSPSRTTRAPPLTTTKKPVPISPWRAITWSAGKSTSTATGRDPLHARPRRRRRTAGPPPAARPCGRGSGSSGPPDGFRGQMLRCATVGRQPRRRLPRARRDLAPCATWPDQED